MLPLEKSEKKNFGAWKGGESNGDRALWDKLEAKMIISFEHDYIFMHARKAGGTYVKLNCYGWLGKNDVAIGGWKTAIEHGITPNARLMNFLTAEDQRGLTEATPSLKKKTVRTISSASARMTNEIGLLHTAHPPISDVQQALGKRFADFEKIAVVRNTYDRVAADYLWRLNKSRWFKPSFLDYLLSIRQNRPNFGFVSNAHDSWYSYSIKGKVVIDTFMRFEHIEHDLSNFIRSRGQEVPRTVGQKINETRHQVKQEKRSLLGDRECEVISEIYSEEIDYFGFNPG